MERYTQEKGRHSQSHISPAAVSTGVAVMARHPLLMLRSGCHNDVMTLKVHKWRTKSLEQSGGLKAFPPSFRNPSVSTHSPSSLFF